MKSVLLVAVCVSSGTARDPIGWKSRPLDISKHCQFLEVKAEETAKFVSAGIFTGALAGIFADDPATENSKIGATAPFLGAATGAIIGHEIEKVKRRSRPTKSTRCNEYFSKVANTTTDYKSEFVKWTRFNVLSSRTAEQEQISVSVNHHSGNIHCKYNGKDPFCHPLWATRLEGDPETGFAVLVADEGGKSHKSFQASDDFCRCKLENKSKLIVVTNNSSATSLTLDDVNDLLKEMGFGDEQRV